MKIGILSDIHGNYYALSAVLNHAKLLGIDHYYILGDLIGYYSNPIEVIKKIRSLKATVIRGNHEDLITKVINKEIKIKELTEKYGEGHEVAIKEMCEKDLEWLIQLPAEKEIYVDNISIKLCHGSPGNTDYYLYPNSQLNILKSFCNNNFDYIFMGHTHYPLIFKYENCSLINVGSVGQSKDIGGLASWGMLDTKNNVYIPYRTPYKVKSLIDDIEKNGNSNKEYLISVLKRNRLDL